MKETSTPNVLSATEHLTRSIHPVLVLQAKLVPESDMTQIGGMTRIGRVYKPEEQKKGQELVAKQNPDLKGRRRSQIVKGKNS